MSKPHTEFAPQWALVELFGHQRIVWLVSEATIAGGAFLRVDVPEAAGEAAFTRFYGASAIYAISPVSEEIGRSLVQSLRPTPVSRYELPAIVDKVAADE